MNCRQHRFGPLVANPAQAKQAHFVFVPHFSEHQCIRFFAFDEACFLTGCTCGCVLIVRQLSVIIASAALLSFGLQNWAATEEPLFFSSLDSSLRYSMWHLEVKTFVLQNVYPLSHSGVRIRFYMVLPNSPPIFAGFLKDVRSSYDGGGVWEADCSCMRSLCVCLYFCFVVCCGSLGVMWHGQDTLFKGPRHATWQSENCGTLCFPVL